MFLLFRQQLPTYGINAGLPTPRERHSAGVLGHRLLIFGGRNDPDPSGDGGPFLNDLWELNPGTERCVSVCDLVWDVWDVTSHMHWLPCAAWRTPTGAPCPRKVRS